MASIGGILRAEEFFVCERERETKPLNQQFLSSKQRHRETTERKPSKRHLIDLFIAVNTFPFFPLLILVGER
ncbi:unnamed protein product [Citrullus colocynthis]|uniref:Uncharacterized protein n=1 Tax=Citrullus colocynthis TaxID=252529 RepID=A0ABP0Z5U6_9ROSI